MPKIKEYSSQVNAAGPIGGRSATAEDFGAGIGRGIQQIGGGIQDIGDAVQKRNELADISEQHKQVSAYHAQKTNELREALRTLKPGDPEYKNFTEKFMTSYQEGLDKLSEGVTTNAGKQFFDRATAEQKGHFQELAQAGQAEVAGIAQRVNFDQTVNANGSSLVNDPTSYKSILAANQLAIQENIRAGMDSKTAMLLGQAAKEKYGADMVQGWIKSDPNGTLDRLKAGDFKNDISGEQTTHLMGVAKTEIRDRKVQQAEIDKAEADKRFQENQQTENGFVDKKIDGSLTVKDVQESNLDPARKEHWIGKIEADLKKADTDNSRFTELFARAKLPPGNPQKLDEEDFDQFLGHGLTYTGLKELRQEVQGHTTEAGRMEADWKAKTLSEAKGILNPKSNKQMGIVDPEGDRQENAFNMWFSQTYRDKRREGKTPQELLTPPSPGRPNPDYMLKDIELFKRSEIDKLNSRTEQITGNPNAPQGPNLQPVYVPKLKVQHLENESPSDYLKRTRGGK